MIAKRKTRSSGPAGPRSKPQNALPQYRKKTPKAPPADAEKFIGELEAQNQELREKQRQIEEAERRYYDLYELAPIGYFVFDQSGTIVDLNLTGARLLGLAKNQIIGTPFIFFIAQESLQPFQQHLRKIFSGDKKEAVELRIRQRYQKSVTHVSIESVPLDTHKGTTCLSAVIDVTGRKLAEKELIKTREELIRSNALLLRQSARHLESQEEERGRVAGDVHDSFASQLSAIKNQLQPLLGKGEDERLTHVLNQLDIAIRDAIRIQKDLRPPALDDLGLTAALNMLCRDFENNHPHIRVEKQLFLENGEIPDAIEVPVYRIAQEALDNVAAHSGADLAIISLTRRDSFIQFAVQDNGHGFTVEETFTSGPGRGLSTMKERAVLSGGLFFVESEAGKGTTLRVSWPFT